MKLKKQNVLLFARTMGQGGTERVVLQLCDILKPCVNKIVVCSNGGVNVKKLDNMGIEHYQIPDITRKNPLDIIQTIAILRKIIKKEKITLIHSHHRMAAFYSKILTTNHIIKIITAHNIFEDKIRLTRWAYKSTNIIAVGNEVKKNLTTIFKLNSNKIKVVYNAVKPFKKESEKLDIFESNNLNGKIIIGNIGRLSRQKGMEYFIRAAVEVHESFPDTFFLIVRAGEDELKLKGLTKVLGAEDFISFIGYQENVQNIMTQLNFVVLSSLWEGFPLTPIESFSVSKTVIGTNIAGTDEIIENYRNGLLVEPKDYISLAEKMKELINDTELIHTLEKQAFVDFQTKFSFEKYRKDIIDFYNTMVAKHEK